MFIIAIIISVDVLSRFFLIECLTCFQGCSLRNTEYIVGAVIFTGHETKVFNYLLVIFILFSSLNNIYPLRLCRNFVYISQDYVIMFHVLLVLYILYIWVVAIFLFQVMMNSMKIPSKRSTLEKKLDKLILALFTVLFCMCLLGSIGRFAYHHSVLEVFYLVCFTFSKICNATLCWCFQWCIHKQQVSLFEIWYIRGTVRSWPQICGM